MRKLEALRGGYPTDARSAGRTATGPAGPPGRSDPASCWPIGSVYMSTSPVSPAVTFGFGSWAVLDSSRLLPGVTFWRRSA